jgi:hypothetical protein
MFITIKDVTVERITKGKSSYNVAEIIYSQNGETKTWKLFDFSNPAVFKTLQGAQKGESFEITTGKNDKDYTVWTNAVKSDGEKNDTSAPSAKPDARKVTSTYETPEERAVKQRLIVRQSSLAQAITISSQETTPVDVDRVLALAERFSAWVYEAPGLFDQPNDIDDIPY